MPNRSGRAAGDDDGAAFYLQHGALQSGVMAVAAQAAARGAHALTPGNLAVCAGNPAPSVDKVTLRLSGGVDPKNDELGALLPGFSRMNHPRGDFL